VNRHDPGALAFRPLCPRCGYDLSGTCDSWTTQCPIAGVCTECGLDLLWMEVLDPIRAVPPWFFEHARRGWLVTLVRTIACSLRPWRFWNAVRMVYAVRFGRLLVVVLLSLLLSHFIVGLQAYILTVRSLAGSAFRAPGSTPWLDSAVQLLWPSSVRPGVAEDPRLGTSPWFFVALIMWAAMPFTFLVMPVTLRRCRVRFGHLVRISAYSTTFLPAVLFGFAALTAFGRLGALGWGSTPGLYDLLVTAFGALPLAAGGCLALVWWHAARSYLKLPHATGVVAAMLAVAFLVGVVGVAFLHPNFAFDAVTRAIVN
jgi:hypothetical protein